MKYQIITNGHVFRVRYGFLRLRTIGADERVSYDEYTHTPIEFPTEEAAEKHMASLYGAQAKRLRCQMWWPCA